MVSYSDEVWAQIKKRWMAGESAGEIAKSPGMPSRQAINRRVSREGWERNLPVVSDNRGKLLPALGKDTPENRQIVLNMLLNGAPLTVISKAIGVHRNTLLDWRKKDPMFDLQCQAMQARDINECLETIKERSKVDWKAAKFRVETSPLTRDEFSQVQPRTHINTIKIGHLIQRDPAHRVPHLFDRDEEPATIEAKAVEVESVTEPMKIERQELVGSEPVVEPIPAQKKPVNRNGVEICPDCKQVPHPGYPHQCLSKRGFPI